MRNNQIIISYICLSYQDPASSSGSQAKSRCSIIDENYGENIVQERQVEIRNNLAAAYFRVKKEVSSYDHEEVKESTGDRTKYRQRLLTQVLSRLLLSVSLSAAELPIKDREETRKRVRVLTILKTAIHLSNVLKKNSKIG